VGEGKGPLLHRRPMMRKSSWRRYSNSSLAVQTFSSCSPLPLTSLLPRALSRSLSSHGRNSLQNSRIGSTQIQDSWQASAEEGLISPRDSWHVVFAAAFMENAQDNCCCFFNGLACYFCKEAEASQTVSQRLIK
jgi:hypothetical protein